MTELLAPQISALRALGAEFHRRGWSVGTSSNYSVVLQREPLELLVTASGKDKGQLAPEDFVRIDAQGRPSVPDQPAASAETMLHVVLARQPNVGAILHTHSVWATVLSSLCFDAGGVALEGYEMLKGLEGITTHAAREWVPIFENTQDIPALSRELTQWLAEHRSPRPHGFLIRRHGLYTWGPTLFAARRHVEIFEFLFECVARESMLASSTSVSSLLG